MNYFFKAPQTLILIGILLIIITGPAFYNKPVALSSDTKNETLGCAATSTMVVAGDNGKFIPLLSGWGYHNYKISTTSDSAQIYFNQGLNFYYSYHFKESLASFKEAVSFDTSSAMAYWGQALSMGPYYNDYYYKMKIEVPEVVKSMSKFQENAGEKEKALIHAMQQRYSSDLTNTDRPRLDSSYAASMHLLTKRYAADDNIKALYIDAVMLQHKWNFWNNDGTPKPWTPELVTLCEAILKNNPEHPAALHYYIHLTEASRTPGRALHSADVLKDLMPGVGHMVHMATHMYQRNGLFFKGVSVNEDANTAYNNIDSLVPNLGIGRNSLLHFYAVQSSCAINAGMYEKGRPIYLRARTRTLELRTSIDKDLYSQFVYMMPVIALVRLGKWQEILNAPLPDKAWKFATVFDNYARGLAHLHDKNLEAAKVCLSSIQQNLSDSLMNVRLMPFNKPVQSAEIAAAILNGAVLFESGKTNDAIAALRQAIELEDKLIYREPQDWIIPARQYLGSYLLKIGKSSEAEKVYQEDLVLNPENGWSLLGMYNSLLARNKKSEALKYKARYTKAFMYADIKPPGSVF